MRHDGGVGYMQYSPLGSTGLTVSKLCFGTLTIGPLQRSFSPSVGGRILAAALERGINLVDTAQLYRTYEHIAWALKSTDCEPVVVSKSYAYTAKDMEAAVLEARQHLGEHIPLVFLLHEQESEHTLRGHWPALEYLLQAQTKGMVQGIGISTHYIRAVEAAAALPEIQVISPLINRSGVGIVDGSRDEMLAACQTAVAQGKTLFAMKPLGGGHLMAQRRLALQYLRDQSWLTSTAVGMKSEQEVAYNVALFSGECVDEGFVEFDRVLHVDSWCTGCAACERACAQQAIRVRQGRAVNDPDRCVFCGYCGAACPEFAIKVI